MKNSINVRKVRFSALLHLQLFKPQPHNKIYRIPTRQKALRDLERDNTTEEKLNMDGDPAKLTKSCFTISFINPMSETVVWFVVI